MGIQSDLPTTRRGYLSRTELAQYADITITDTAEADENISQAEEIIDTYAGFSDKFFPYSLDGRATSGTSTTITLDSLELNKYEKDYFKGCEVEIIGGTGEGQRRKITTSSYAGVITVDAVFTTIPDSTSFYHIYQLGKFPRRCDVKYWTNNEPYQYFKSIPEAVKRAVAAQVEFTINMGDNFFSTNSSSKNREKIGDYEYEQGGGGGGSSVGGGTNLLIAPKAKMFMRGIRDISGEL